MSFKTLTDYQCFVDEVTHNNRTFLSEDSISFLEWFEKLISSKHCLELEAGRKLYRARKNKEQGIARSAQEMKPIKNLGSSGRANAFNISVLYLSDHEDIALLECRPELREEFTVATFQVQRALKLIDLAGERPNWGSYFGYHRMRGENQLHHEQQCLVKIGGNFSKSLDPESKAIDYIPTQVITEYFKHKGYDGVAYQTQFQVLNKPGLYRNYAFFDLDSANAIGSEITSVNEISIKTTQVKPFTEY